MSMAVAVDGPAGAGKSSVSKAVAKQMNFIYIDTGAMYRACALYALKNGIEIKEENLTDILDNIKIAIAYRDDEQHIFLCGDDVTDKIRTPEVSMGASKIAAVPSVRLKLVELQRELAQKNNVIMDGRDIGTYVLPNADLKIYLTASADARAKRRFDEMTGEKDFEAVKNDIIERDKNDMGRKFAPLRKADDAFLIDSSDMSFDEVCSLVIKLIQRGNV